MSINRVLLEHDYAYSFMYCLVFFHCSAEVNNGH